MHGIALRTLVWIVIPAAFWIVVVWTIVAGLTSSTGCPASR